MAILFFLVQSPAVEPAAVETIPAKDKSWGGSGVVFPDAAVFMETTRMLDVGSDQSDHQDFLRTHGNCNRARWHRKLR